ncbi:A1S_1983 family putative colistin resistance protein [Acinetobacter lanii]|uniref:DUF1311 domain-containing protein n=1 Tax=Acinetobacter lanii TaxID=2715163 RepID=A0A6G8S5B5_9GAMM|nr:hypothetical protein [Acinetobacter lanii]QIO09163.1 hypothetical protein G8D99_09135 [Acinetobacter lanii]
MLLKNVSNSMKTIVSGFFLSALGTITLHAQPLQCESKNSPQYLAQICSEKFKDLRKELNELQHTSYLVTDAPLRLLADTHQLWFNRMQQCKNSACYKQQLNLRIEDLNFYTSMNQSLTQHYLKFEHGQIAQQPIQLKVHQLTKDRIKIEGFAYRNPNNRLESQAIPLLAYTTPDQKNEILDNEHDCKYQLNFQKALLVVNTTQSGCERFKGVYRLYD